ncbi:MAG: response regulator [Bacilli bacterium]
MEKKVLVVDDQEGIRFLLNEVFKRKGYVVELADNGLTALEKAQTFTPDVVVLDMKMPGMDGIETLQHLKKMPVPPYVVLMTAYSEVELLGRARSEGVDDIVAKPFDINVLSEAVEKFYIK